MNLIKLVLRMLVLCPFVMHAQVPDPCSTSNLGGVAWMDNDYDGAVGANELQKVEGITVQIYDCNGDLVGTDVTDVNGDWHYDGTLTYPVRVEFSNIENGSYPTFDGTGTGTTVQFVSAASCAINLGIASPVNFCPSGTVILPCYATDVNQTSVAYFPYSNSGTTPTPLETASISDVGGLWGGTYTVTVTNASTGCTGVCNITLTTPTNCCNINAIVPQNLECVDNGTPSIVTDNRIRFNAMVTNTNTSLTGYNVTINGGTTITPNTNVPYGVTQFTLGAGTAGGGATYTITVTDSATPGCTRTFQVVDPGTCEPATPECPPVQCGTASIQVNGN